MSLRLAAALVATAALTACSSTMVPSNLSNPTAAPAAVQPPSGNRMALDSWGVGEITYECREKTGAAGQFDWVFVAPVATLYDMQNRVIGKYYGGPTWEAADGSKVTGKQVAVAPASAGNIPLQLVKADPAMDKMDKGAMTGVTYIQRLETKGGIAPSAACNASAAGTKQQVGYQAKYVFYKQN